MFGFLKKKKSEEELYLEDLERRKQAQGSCSSSSNAAFELKVEDVFAACTSTPARAIGMSGEIGTLHPGAPADIAVFRLEERNVLFYDCHENTMEGRQILVPQMTVKDGCIMFRQVTFSKEF